jgi:uroporphyrinogen-III synthase
MSKKTTATLLLDHDEAFALAAALLHANVKGLAIGMLNGDRIVNLEERLLQLVVDLDRVDAGRTELAPLDHAANTIVQDAARTAAQFLAALEK